MFTVADPGPEGPKKYVFETAPPPLSQGMDDCPPPPSYLKVLIHHWFKLYRIALTPTRKPYRSRLLYVHT